MRILYCNKYNYPFSGTEAYLFEVMDLMRSQGHQVALFSMADPRGEPTPYDRYFLPHIDFKNQPGLWRKAKLAAHAIYSRDARRRIRALIEDFRPDVAHVRNIYHHLSPSILFELKAQNVPVVYHLNDFKLLCPSYNMVSQGESCEACKGGEFWHMMAVKCYPGRAERITLLVEAYIQRWLGTYTKCVDRFLAPSQFVRDKFVEHGWNAEKFDVLPHFQTMPSHTVPSRGKGAPLLYFGRLSQEKGVADLVRAMKLVPGMRLTIAGEGPQRDELQKLAGGLGLANVEFVGHVRGAELHALVARSQFTVLPSHAYETLGKTILESYAEARAVVASDLGSRRELVHEGETGLLYPTGDVKRLAACIRALGEDPALAEEMGRKGRELVRERYNPAAHCEALVGLYKRTIAMKRIVGKRKDGGRAALVATSQAPPWGRIQPQAIAISDSETVLASRKPHLRIAFIGGRGVISKYSGIETYYEEVGALMAQMGHEVTVYCRSYFTPSLIRHHGMRLVRLPTIRSKHWETLLHTILSTAHVSTQECDVVHYHALGPALFSFVPRLFGKKTVVTVQGLDWQRKKWGWLASQVLRLGERASVQLPSGTMVVSQALRKHYRKEHGVDTFYVPNGGILRERREPAKILEWGLEPGKYILFLGRFSPEKNCHLLIEAYEQLDTNVRLVLAGGSSYCDGYARNLRSHASDRILMLDWISGETLDELLTNAMVFVLPSDVEGLSLALLDAMGAGLCVLTSNIPENRELVEEAGFTFEHGNSADLADRLRFLLANPAVREAAGRAAKDRIRAQYLWPTIAESIEQVYFKITRGGKPDTGVKKPNARVEPADASARAKRAAG